MRPSHGTFATPAALAAGFWLAFSAASALAADPAPAATPRATIEKPEFDAGEVIKGKEVEAVYLVRNDGTGELRLLSVKPG